MPILGTPTILIITADSLDASRLSRALKAERFSVRVAADESEALDLLRSVVPDVVVLDLDLPDDGAERLASRLFGSDGFPPVILMLADEDNPRLADGLRRGAHDYVVRPVSEQKFRLTVRQAAARRHLELQVSSLRREVEAEGYPGISGRSASMRRLFRQLDRIAHSEATILIRGESGTGKELIARTIHDQSSRTGPFIAVNCAAIPTNLEESELFGHEKGAFTGAHERQIGKFEQANGGTLFLDEIGELSLALQAKLLRALQERSFHRVGGRELIRSDFRLVAATHRDLAAEMKSGGFREDLYFRVAVVELEVPPLRRREGDVVLLAHQFLAELETENDDLVFGLDALEAMVTYQWPGNVRELRNAVERGVVLAEGSEIGLKDLPARIADSQIVSDADELSAPGSESPQERRSQTGPEDVVVLGEGVTLDKLEQLAIEAAFRRTGGNVTEMSRQLDIGRTALYRKLKRYAAVGSS